MVLAFSAGLSVAAGLVFGSLPALSWSRLHLVRALTQGSAPASGGFRILSANRTRAALAVTQVALALVLLVGAGLLLRSFVRLVSVDPGYDAGNVLTARINHPDLGRLTPGRGVRGRGRERRTLHRGATGATGAGGRPAGHRRRRVVDGPAVNPRRVADAGACSRSSGTGQSVGLAAGPRADGQSRLLRRHAAAPARRTCIHAAGRARQFAGRRRQRDAGA